MNLLMQQQSLIIGVCIDVIFSVKKKKKCIKDSKYLMKIVDWYYLLVISNIIFMNSFALSMRRLKIMLNADKLELRKTSQLHDESFHIINIIGTCSIRHVLYRYLDVKQRSMSKRYK